MNRDETRTLLSGAAALDRWLKATDPDMAVEMVEGWSAILSDVPLEFAQNVTRAHYSVPDARTLQPGDIAGEWAAAVRHRAVEEQTREARQEAREQLQDPVPIGEVLMGSEGGGSYLRAMMEAIDRGEDPATVPRPAGVRLISAEADRRSRRCVYHELCACDHTGCRAGWSDVEAVTIGANGREYPTAVRCSQCRDALLMAEERGVAKKVGAHQAGRRR